MDGLSIISVAPFVSAGISASFVGLTRKRHPLHLYWAAFAAGICLYSIEKAFEGQLGPLAVPIAVLTSATCGLSWLLARVLFNPAGGRKLWPFYVVAAQFLTAAIVALAPGVHPADGPGGAFIDVMHNLRSLISSTVLLMTFIEPIRSFASDLPVAEKRFRLVFIGGYAALVVASVLTDTSALTGQPLWEEATKAFCAMLALLMASAAVAFRMHHPLHAPLSEPSVPPRRVPVLADGEYLRERIRQKIEDHNVYKRPELKVSDLARMVGEPEYRVTQCITTLMGHANFNRLINAYRLAHAKRLLSDPKCDDWSILSIAMDCGFASIGPFNRAFREDTGMTPSQYRAARIIAADI